MWSMHPATAHDLVADRVREAHLAADRSRLARQARESRMVRAGQQGSSPVRRLVARSLRSLGAGASALSCRAALLASRLERPAA